LHGHTYTVEVVLSAQELAGPGFVTDFGELQPFRRYLDTTFDHRFLNEVLACEPTSENLAVHLARWFQQNLEPGIAGGLVSVRVSETPTSWAEYTVGLP
jgi:6-pyruvoyltetrahydropterin/6-carboxytetrahydropterin synthase